MFAKFLLVLFGVVAALLMADIALICFLDETLLGLFTEPFYEEPLTAVLKRSEGALIFLFAALLILYRKQVLSIVASLMDRAEQTLAAKTEISAADHRRPKALLIAALLFLGVLPVFIYMLLVFLTARAFFVWPLVHACWLVIATIVLVGLIKGKKWAYRTLIGACVTNILLATYLCLGFATILAQAGHTVHGFGAGASIAAFFALVVILFYTALSIALLVYLWVRRKNLVPADPKNETSS